MTEFDPTTKITRRSPVNNSQARPIPAKSESSSGPEANDRVTLSNKPQKPVPEAKTTGKPGGVRQQLVGKFRDVLEKGTYRIKANEIADKMVQKIQEQKDRTII